MKELYNLKDKNSEEKNKASDWKLWAGIVTGAAAIGAMAYGFAKKDEISNWLKARNIIPSTLDHIMNGNFQTDFKQPSGGHSINNDNVRVIGRRQKFPNSNFAYFAESVEIYNPVIKTWVPKKTNKFYTMFCDDWEMDRIEEELYSAYKDKEFFTKSGTFSHKQIQEALDLEIQGYENNLFYKENNKTFSKEPLMWHGTTKSDLVIEGYLHPYLTAYPKPYKHKKFTPRWKKL